MLSHAHEDSYSFLAAMKKMLNVTCVYWKPLPIRTGSYTWPWDHSPPWKGFNCELNWGTTTVNISENEIVSVSYFKFWELSFTATNANNWQQRIHCSSVESRAWTVQYPESVILRMLEKENLHNDCLALTWITAISFRGLWRAWQQDKSEKLSHQASSLPLACLWVVHIRGQPVDHQRWWYTGGGTHGRCDPGMLATSPPGRALGQTQKGPRGLLRCKYWNNYPQEQEDCTVSEPSYSLLCVGKLKVSS